MTCNDIIQIKELSGLKLVAGSAGLSHNVRWIYFSESSTHVNDIKTLGNWVSGGELFVCTNEKILEDKNLIINMIKNANELGAAGIILNVGSIEAEYIELAEKFSLPLFEIPWSIRLVDLSQIICTHLIREQKEENSFERLLSSVIFTHFDSEDDIILNCKYYGFDLTKKNRIAIFKIVDNTDFKTKKEDKKSKIRSYFQRCIKNGFRDAGVKKIMSLLQYNMVTVLFPDDMFCGQSFESMVDIIALHWKYSHPDIDFHVGVGNVCSGANGAKRSLFRGGKGH